jgi:hypothetical protein
MLKYIAIAVAVVLAAAQLALIVAKLLGHIHWSWWLVLTPIWGPIVVVVILAIIAIAMFTNSSGNPFQ